MIADWTVELGGDASTIDVPWPGWVDLHWDRRWHSDLARPFPEVRSYPELEALLSLANYGHTRTSKVDVFPVSRDEVDPEIAEAGMEETAYGLGSYVDLVIVQTAVCSSFPECEALARTVTRRLQQTPLPLAMAELVLRPAHLYDKQLFGWTLYAMGFGSSQQAARAHWIQAATLLACIFQLELASRLTAPSEAQLAPVERPTSAVIPPAGE